MYLAPISCYYSIILASISKGLKIKESTTYSFKFEDEAEDYKAIKDDNESDCDELWQEDDDSRGYFTDLPSNS